MSTTSTKRPLKEALRDAHAFRDLFPRDCYRRWEIVGSVRRGKEMVGDIEHLIQPAYGAVTPPGSLFPVVVNLLWHRLDELFASGNVAKHTYGATGNRWGPKHRGVDWRGYLNEIYTADDQNWGSQLLIRTGPEDFSHRVVTVIRDAGMYRQQEGHLVHVASGEVVPVPDEQTYLKLAGMDWVAPKDRR